MDEAAMLFCLESARNLAKARQFDPETGHNIIRSWDAWVADLAKLVLDQQRRIKELERLLGAKE